MNKNNSVKKGVLLVVSAPSGCGKDTVLEQVYSRCKTLNKSVSATSRAPRKGEVDGVHYHFVSKSDFSDMIELGQLIEYTSYVDNFYGTLRDKLISSLEAGEDICLKIETEGAANIKKAFPDCATVFIAPPSVKILEKRLRGRGTDSEEVIRDRLNKAQLELMFAPRYDYVVVNDELEAAIDDVCAIYRAEQLRNKN